MTECMVEVAVVLEATVLEEGEPAVALVVATRIVTTSMAGKTTSQVDLEAIAPTITEVSTTDLNMDTITGNSHISHRAKGMTGDRAGRITFCC